MRQGLRGHPVYNFHRHCWLPRVALRHMELFCCFEVCTAVSVCDFGYNNIQRCPPLHNLIPITCQDEVISAGERLYVNLLHVAKGPWNETSQDESH